METYIADVFVSLFGGTDVMSIRSDVDMGLVSFIHFLVFQLQNNMEVRN